MRIINSFRVRLMFLVGLAALGFCYIFVYLFYIQIVKGDEWREKGDKQYQAEEKIKSKRGRIIASDGEILAYDTEDYIVTLNPDAIKNENIDEILNIIGKYVSNFDAEKIKKEYISKKQQKKKYLKINAAVGISEKKSILEEFRKSKILGNGVNFEVKFKRNYVNNNAFQEMLGYTNSENRGVYGIEKFYDEQLTGVDGLIKGARRPSNFMIIPLIKDKKEMVTAKDGNNVILTIDSVLQYTLDDEMRSAYISNNAVSTMGVLMEVETGKILAMSSYPKAESNANVKNRVITDLFEPGSIFKPITVAMGLQSGVINENTVISSSGSIQVADRVIRDHDGSTTGTLSLETLVAKSGNVGMVKISKMMSKKQFYEYLQNIGLGNKTGIDIFSESTAKLLPENKLTEVRKANISFGQGISMTQLQMLMALNTVVNNGKLMQPYIVDRLEDDSGNIVLQNKPKILQTVFSEEVSRLNREYMEAVVTRGTGTAAYIPEYRIGGKTGTAQKAGSSGYQSGKYFSSFFAFFPVDNPKYAILITINEPRGSKFYGAAVALPSAKAVLEKLIRYKGVTPKGIVDESRKEVNVVQEKPKDLKKILNEFNKNKMPDLTGLSLRELLTVYPQAKFPEYKISGSGKVRSQTPQAGTSLTEDTEVRLELQ